MSSSQHSSKIEDLIINIIGGTLSNLLPMLILGLIAGLGRFLLGTTDTILFLATAIICIGIATLTSKRRVRSRSLRLSRAHASGLVLLTIATSSGLSSMEPWCSYEPIYFIVTTKDGNEYTVKHDLAEIEQNQRLVVKLVPNSKIHTGETLTDGFICAWNSADETNIASSNGCFMWFDTNITPKSPENHITVEYRHESCKRREQRILSIKLNQ